MKTARILVIVKKENKKKAYPLKGASLLYR